MFNKLRDKIIDRFYKSIKIDVIFNSTLKVMNLHTAQINILIDRLETERTEREEMQKYFINEIQQLREKITELQKQKEQTQEKPTTQKYH